ncbi:MAG: universal stress protein [Chitinophagaceae bacterium]|nr:universal stress protein [Chitinophagaceae bacterium]
MNTILVATDMTNASKNATEYAGQLCKAWNCSMLLLNVAVLPAPLPEVAYNPVGIGEMITEFEGILSQEAARIFGMFDIEVQPRVVMGILDVEIAETARELNAALIVMGKKVPESMDRIFGSTADTVIRKATVPVLVIPEHISFSGISSIAYATDLNYNIHANTFRPVKTLADSFGSAVKIVHVKKPGDIMSQEDIAGKVKLSIATEGLHYEYFTISDEHIEDGLQRFLADNPTTILAMTAHKHSFLERLFGKRHTKSMLYQIDIPLLVLHDQPKPH